MTAHVPIPITILPAFGALLLAFGAHDAGPFTGSRALVGAALAGALVAFVLAVWNPPWFGPQWFRAMKTSGEPIDPDRTDPLTASTYALARSDVDARAPVAERFGDSKALESWRVSLVDGEVKVGGHLELHPAGIAFYPNDMEARIRDDPVAVVVERHDLVAIRTAGGTGFEVETGTGSVHRFEAFFPGRIVKRLEGARARS